MIERLKQESGVAIITVVLLAMVVAAVAATLMLRSLRNYDETLAERQRVDALSVAESGLDAGVFELNEDDAYFSVPNSYGYAAPFTTDQAERAWVLTAVSALALSPTGSGNGEYVIVKPQGRDVVYAVGYIPTLIDADVSRVVKLQYGQFAHSPAGLSEALIADGNISISGNSTFTGTLGNIHANGNLSSSGATAVSGHASSGGSYSGTFITGDPANSGSTGEVKTVPRTEPIRLHHLSEYDMCNNGRVYAGPAHSDPTKQGTAGAPCSGTELANANGTEYRGWRKIGTESNGAANWDYTTEDKYPGVYFFDGGNAKIEPSPGEGTSPWEATIIANPIGGVSCPNNRGGDIEFSGNPFMIPYSAAEPWLLVAGRDLKVSGNADSYGRPGNEALVTSIEQVTVSGNPHTYGAFIINDECDTPGSLIPRTDLEISGNPIFTFNGEFGYPGTGRAGTTTTSRWSEL